MAIDFNMTIVAKRTAKAIQEGWPIIFNEGGSGSSKTYSEVGICILLCIDDKFREKILRKHYPSLLDKPLRISLVSQSLPHIKRGMLRDFKAQMDKIRQWDDSNWSATNFIYTFKGGHYIELFGLEDEGKARGPRRDILVVNEGNLIKKMLFDQLAMRTTGPIIVDLNPSDFNSWCYTMADLPTNKRLHSTYADNIENLTRQQINYIESYKNLPDDFMWKVYGLGERGASKELIYTKWRKVDKLPGKGDRFYGLDFGYVHPLAMVEVEHYEGANYIKEILYTPGKTLADIIKIMDGMGISKRLPIYADSAEPKSIEEIFRAGYNIHKSDKDVWAGILHVKSYPMFVTVDSPNLHIELSSYKWAKNRNDEVIEEPIKKNDDGLDAVRMAIHTHLTKPKLSWITL